MKVRVVLTGLVLTLVGELVQAAPPHPCAADARARAKDFLAFYRRPDETGFAGQWSVDNSVTQVGTSPALQGKRRYDVLEVWGNVYKGRYRMRFMYARLDGQCVLMGEEIIEDSAL